MSKDNYERNIHPVYGQKEATVKDSVCNVNTLIKNEGRSHRRVGYKNSVSKFHMLVMSKCYELSVSLYNGTYKPEKGEKHEVYEPKYRVTRSSKYPDRIVQSSFITNYYYDNVIVHLSNKNCACIKGRGVDYAREMLKECLRIADEDDCCVKVDMKGYFASIIHEILYNELSEFIDDEWAMSFFKLTVENSDGDIGLDLGSEVYQLAATSFLNAVDQMFTNCKYLRYQDDLVFIGCKDDCNEFLNVMKREAERLGLTLHKKKTYVQSIKRPIKFLGFTFLKHPNGKITLKRLPEKIRHERRKLRRMFNKNVPYEQISAHYQSVRACLKKGSRSDLMKMDKFFNELYERRKLNECKSAEGQDCH